MGGREGEGSRGTKGGERKKERTKRGESNSRGIYCALIVILLLMVFVQYTFLRV